MKRSGFIERKTRINPKRKKPRRKRPELFGTGHGIRLYGAAREKRRAEIFERAGNYCEEIIRCPLPECNEGGKAWHVYRCPNKPTEWSHKRHGSHRCDCMACGIASCKSCHRKRHAGGNGKPVAISKKSLQLEAR